MAAQQYDPKTISLHWIVAFGVVGQWLGAHAIDWFPKGELRVDARSMHILVGALLTVAVGHRLYWRRTSGKRFPVPQPSSWERLASLVHAALYLLLAATLLIGLFNAWVRGDDFFGLFHLPKYGGFDPEARHSIANRVVGLHRLAANALLILAAGHGLAGLFHYVVRRDDVLQRMMPLLGRPQP